MLLRIALAESLDRHDCTAEALDHYLELLELCPDDDVVVRVSAASAALTLERLELVEELCERYPDSDFAWHPWTQALAAFSRSGPSDEARACLERACQVNPHVAAVLAMGPVDARVSGFEIGSREEALAYAGVAQRAWWNVPDALSWLHWERELTRLPRARGSLERLLRLPRDEGAWLVDARGLPGTLEAEQSELWATVVVEAETGLVRGVDVSAGMPSESDALGTIERAMLTPKSGRPARPRSLVVPEQLVAACAANYAHLELSIQGRHTLGTLDEPFAALAASLAGEGGGFPAWTKGPGVDDERVLGLCQAAAFFFEATPWHLTGGEVGFVLSPENASGQNLLGDARPCAVVMGTHGETFGLALYDSLEVARRVVSGAATDAFNPATVLTYDPHDVLNPEDLQRIYALGCERVGRDALPLVFRVEAGGTGPVEPTAAQLAQLAAALRAVASLLLQHGLRGKVGQILDGYGEVELEVQREILDPEHVAASLPDLAEEDPAAAARRDAILEALEEGFAKLPQLDPGPCLGMASLLCIDPEAPLHSGSARPWAAGLVYAYAQLSGALGDAVALDDLSAAFGVSAETSREKGSELSAHLMRLSRASAEEGLR